MRQADSYEKLQYLSELVFRRLLQISDEETLVRMRVGIDAWFPRFKGDSVILAYEELMGTLLSLSFPVTPDIYDVACYLGMTTSCDKRLWQVLLPLIQPEPEVLTVQDSPPAPVPPPPAPVPEEPEEPDLPGDAFVLPTFTRPTAAPVQRYQIQDSLLPLKTVEFLIANGITHTDQLKGRTLGSFRTFKGATRPRMSDIRQFKDEYGIILDY